VSGAALLYTEAPRRVPAQAPAQPRALARQMGCNPPCIDPSVFTVQLCETVAHPEARRDCSRPATWARRAAGVRSCSHISASRLLSTRYLGSSRGGCSELLA
jgi:hypothetical protein